MNKKCSFNDFNLSDELLKAIADQGFEEASPIQAQAIPEILAGKDIVGQAATGSGKTAAFAIPSLEKLDPSIKKPQILVLCPVRELAIQVAEQFNKFASHKKGVLVQPVFGGQSLERQIQGLRRGANVVIGTPGRLIDHIQRKTINLSAIKTVILDEADKMLDMGFRPDIERILQQTSQRSQTLLFSATMPREIMAIAKQYQNEPLQIKIAHEAVSAPAIDQFYIDVESNKKLDVITRLIDTHNPTSCILFSNTKRRVDDLVIGLKDRGYAAVGIHGDITQEKRNRIMTKFKGGEADILVATDVAARGIDISHIEIVFNYDIPQDEDSYVHRIGRTGRGGKKGTAFSLVSRREFGAFKDIKRYTKATIKRVEVPTDIELENTRYIKVLQLVKQTVQDNNLHSYSRVLSDFFQDDVATLDVCAALLKLYTERKKS